MQREKLTILDIQRMKADGRKITMLSICDYPMALIAEKSGLDMILVGDSLGMTSSGISTDSHPSSQKNMRISAR